MWMQDLLIAAMRTFTHPPILGDAQNLNVFKAHLITSANLLHFYPSCPHIVYRFHSLAAPQGEAPLVQPLTLQATSFSDLWMQGSLLDSMQTCTHPAMPSATFHNHNILIF